jgi:hypothetical protein
VDSVEELFVLTYVAIVLFVILAPLYITKVIVNLHVYICMGAKNEYSIKKRVPEGHYQASTENREEFYLVQSASEDGEHRSLSRKTADNFVNATIFFFCSKCPGQGNGLLQTQMEVSMTGVCYSILKKNAG